MNFGVSNLETAADEPNLTPETHGMAHMAGNEPNFWHFIKKYEVKKSVPKKCKTAWALGLKTKKTSGFLSRTHAALDLLKF